MSLKFHRAIIAAIGLLLVLSANASAQQSEEEQQKGNYSLFVPVAGLADAHSRGWVNGDNVYISRTSAADLNETFWTEEKFRNAIPLSSIMEQDAHLAPVASASDTGADAQGVPEFHLGKSPMPEFIEEARRLYPDAWQPASTWSVHATEWQPMPYSSTDLEGFSANPPFNSYYANLYEDNWQGYPLSTIGKLIAETPSGLMVECSGSVIDDRIVLTAGHCIYFHGWSGDTWLGHGWAQQIAFFPAYRDFDFPYGWFSDSFLTTKSKWANEQDPAFDLGMIVIADSGGASIGSWVGWLGLAWDLRVSQQFQAFGYPANFGNGEYLYNSTAPRSRTDVIPGPDATGIGCDMTFGSSGGPFVMGYRPYYEYQTNFVNGLVSYGYSNQPDVIYSPYFGGALRDLFRFTQRLAD